MIFFFFAISLLPVIPSFTQVLTQLKKVNFSQNGYHVSFDANGDPVAMYELVNWQKSKSGSIELVTVGHFDASLPVGQEFHINRNLTWLGDSTQVRGLTAMIYCIILRIITSV